MGRSLRSARHAARKRNPRVIAFIDTLDKRRPSAETIAALEEADRIIRDPNVKAYTDIDEMFAELRAECIK